MTRQTAKPLLRWTQADYRRERIGIVYALVDPRDRQFRYVGYTSISLAERLRQHIRLARRRRGVSHYHAIHWLNVLDDLGLQPDIVALDTYVAGRWRERERFWIDVLRQLGCDLTNSIAGGGAGGPHAMSQAPRRMSLEQRAKLSVAARRRYSDPAQRRATSEAKKGRPIKAWTGARPALCKSHCPSGHEYTEENSVTYPGKRKQCRTCIRERTRRYRARLVGAGTPQTNADMDNARRVAEGG